MFPYFNLLLLPYSLLVSYKKIMKKFFTHLNKLNIAILYYYIIWIFNFLINMKYKCILSFNRS